MQNALNEITGEWRGLHNEELHGLYHSPDVVNIMKLRRLRWAGHVARMGRKRRLYSGWNIIRRRPLGRPRHRWYDNIRNNCHAFVYFLCSMIVIALVHEEY